MTAYWEHFPHVADMGVRGVGDTPEQAFAQAALALTAVVCDPQQVATSESVTLHAQGSDREILLVDWLNQLVFVMATRHMLFARFEVHFEDGGLTARAWGEPLVRSRHQPAVEVKGATYTGLHVGQRADGRWEAACVVDV